MKTIIRHYRYDQNGMWRRYRRGREDWQPHPKGGRTGVTLLHGGKAYIGIAECSPEDNFYYRAGRWIATYRALQQMPYQEAIEYPNFRLLELYVHAIEDGGSRYAIELLEMYLRQAEQEWEAAKECAAATALWGAYMKMQRVSYALAIGGE